MMNYDHIERYCKNLMSQDEKEAFENEMRSNSILEEEVRLFKNNILIIENEYSKSVKVNQLKDTLSEMGEEYFSKPKAVNRPLKRLFYIASSAAAVLICAFLLFSESPDLYAEYAVHNEFNVQVKGNPNVTLQEASRLFNREKYKEAIIPLENYLKEDSDLEVEFNLGICYLETNQIDRALVIFSDQEITDSIFKDKAQWYLALAHLKGEKLNRVKQVLENINKTSVYHKKAVQLLKDLEK